MRVRFWRLLDEKEKTMKTHTLTALCTVLALTAAPSFAKEEAFSGLDVKVELSDYQNSNALEYWPDLEKDLTMAIMDQVNTDPEAEAPKIEVTLQNVAVDGDSYLPDSGEFNQLSGTVEVFRGNDDVPIGQSAQASPNDLVRNFVVNVTAVTGDADVPVDWVVINPSQDDFYDAMVTAFATQVIERYDD